MARACRPMDGPERHTFGDLRGFGLCREKREKPVDAEAPHVVLVDFGTARRMEEVKGEPIGHAAASRVDLRRSDRESPKVCDSLLQVPQASRPQAEARGRARGSQRKSRVLSGSAGRSTDEGWGESVLDFGFDEEQEETVAIPTHYAQRLVNFAGKDVLQKCMRLRLARAWSSNQMPSFRRLFVALAPQGRLPPARLVAALSCSGLAERYGSAALVAQAAQQAADALVNEEGAISFTLFVAALADLGDPKYENFLLQSFEQVDHDDDSLLGIEDLAELLSADMKRHAVLLQEFMVALTGHASPGTKLEWRQFLRHFQSRDAAEAAPREASESPEAPDVAKGPDAFFQHFAGTLLDRAVEQMSGP
ncbi:unnamed protein product [Durusdinium trenchii]|uniref:EF-hand domain-containing protein n=1 Tax=Durusdinium trenchii TaxID=1381693 RepID=A0ABP0RA79_9DINO